jgi:hypothetical protein
MYSRNGRALLAHLHGIFESLQFDATLNLAWALLGILALLRTLCASRRVARHSSRRRQLFEAVGVASIIIALFPFISATDDVMRVEQYASQHKNQQSPGGHHTDVLRLFETADHSLVTRSPRVGVTLVLLDLVTVAPGFCATRIAPLIAGRSPPSFVSV